MTDEPRRRLVLWGVGTSRTLRAHWALHELGLDYECRPILPRTGETQTPAYTELNPRQKVPLLQDGDFTIGESAAIAAYLSNTYGTPENALVPADPREHATWLEWCFYAATELDATGLYVMRRHGDLKHIYGEAPAALESAAGYFATQLRYAEQALQGRPAVSGRRAFHHCRHAADHVLNLGGELSSSGHSGLPGLYGEDHLSGGLPRRRGGQQAEIVIGAQLAAAFSFVKRRAPEGSLSSGRCRGLLAPGPRWTWTCFATSGSPHSEHTITGSKSSPQRSCVCNSGRPFFPDMWTSPQ